MDLGPLRPDVPLKRSRNNPNYDENIQDQGDGVDEDPESQAERPLPSERNREDMSRYRYEASL